MSTVLYLSVWYIYMATDTKVHFVWNIKAFLYIVVCYVSNHNNNVTLFLNVGIEILLISLCDNTFDKMICDIY